MGLYLLTNDLNALAVHYKKEILSHYRSNLVVSNIVQIASEGLVEPSADDLNVKLQARDVNPIVIDSVLNAYADLDRGETTINGIRHFYKNLITSKMMDAASGITDSAAYIKEITRIGKLDFGEVSKVDSAIKTKKFSELDIAEMEASMNRVVPSFWEPLNESNPYKGYREEQLITVCGAPGCFFGDTEVIINDGIFTMKELYESKQTNIPVYCVDNEFQECSSVAESCQLTKYVTTYAVVTVGNKEIKCTVDHQFLLMNGEYVEAQNLLPGDTLYSPAPRCFKVKNIELKTSDDPIPVYDLVNVDKYHNFEVHVGQGYGIVVHNSGKSLFLMQELLKSLELGRHVVYCAIGDLIEEDFIVRLAALKYKVPMTDIYLDFRYYQRKLVEDLPSIDKMSILFIKPGALSAIELRDYLYANEFKDEPTTFFIDYDSNLNGNESLYVKGDEIYSVGEEMAARPGYLGFIATQPKIMFFGSEMFSMEGLGESSRKAHISATIITIGINQNAVNPVGYINIAKQRRGTKFACPYFRDLNGEFIRITEQQKSELAQCATRRTFFCQTSDADRYET